MVFLALLLFPSLLLFAEEGGFYSRCVVGGAKADNPQIGFYGTTESPIPPLAVFDADLGGVFAEGEVAFGRSLSFTHFPFVTFSICSSLFFGEWRSAKELGAAEDIDLLALFAIDGSGAGLFLPITQIAHFHAEERISDSAFLGRFLLEECGPFRFTLSVGPALYYRVIRFKSTLDDYVSGDANGVISERISSLFIGGRVGFELEVSPGSMRIQLIPEVTFYGGWHRFQGTMDFGVNEISSLSYLQQSQHGAYDAKIRALVSTALGCGEVGIELFAHFISYAPGVFNPRSSEDGAAHLTNQNATLWGGALFAKF